MANNPTGFNPNMPLGTYLQDGLRIGPYYTNQLSATVPTSGVLTTQTYNNYGPGVFLSPLVTYDITPIAVNPVGGFTVLNNIVAQTAAGGIPAGNLTLTSDNFVTTSFLTPYGTAGLQLDWPRVPQISLIGAAPTAGTRVTIFGTDYYRNAMQATYVLGANAGPTLYPTINAGPPKTLTWPAGSTNVAGSAKAFYTITGVNLSAALPNTCQLSIGASSIFGLPYYTQDQSAIVSLAWNGASEMSSNGAAAYTQNAPLAPLGFFTGGLNIYNSNTNPTQTNDYANVATLSTATNGDVRGLYQPFAGTQATTGGVNGTSSLIYTMYPRGANVYINQLNANGNQQYVPAQTAPVLAATTDTIPPLIPALLYGAPQFYTGLPS